LELVRELQLGSDSQQRFIDDALAEVNNAPALRFGTCACRRVFVMSSRAFTSGASMPVLSSEQLNAIGAQLEVLLEAQGAGEADLAICGGTAEEDVLFAETCLKRSMRVRLSKRAAADRTSTGAFSSDEWRSRSRALTTREPSSRKEIWSDDEQLGPVIAIDGSDSLEAVSRQRHVEWLHNTAWTEAEREMETEDSANERLIVISSDDREGDDADGGSWVDRLQQNGLRVKTISLSKLAGS
jgi:hypothetical protein